MARCNRTEIRLLLASALVLWAGALQAAWFTNSPTPPTVRGDDIACFATPTGSDKWWPDPATAYGNPGKTVGQTFRTGNAALYLKAVTFKIAQATQPTKTYTIRVGVVSGTAFTPIASETATQTVATAADEYWTWTLASPVLLLPNTVYGVDVGLNASTSAWQTGIPYVYYSADAYPGGTRFRSGTAGYGVGDTNMSDMSGDRLFHIALEKPLSSNFVLVATSPGDDATNVVVPCLLVATFSQNLARGTGYIRLKNLTDSTESAIRVTDPRVVITDNLLSIDPGSLCGPNEAYAVRIDPTALRSESGLSFPGITNDTTWNFTTGAGDPFLLAVRELTDYINGFTNLTAAQIAADSVTIDANKDRFPESSNTIAAVFELVRTYDRVKGPLWVATGPLTRSSETNDLTWTIYRVMQAIMDKIYNTQTLTQYEALLNGFKFGSASNFPGPCPAPPTNQTYTVAINASFPKTFGRDTQGWTVPARRPTGAYLAPGTIAIVTVPPALVGKGYQIRVGAHSWDMSSRPSVRRLDRSSLLYDIAATTTKVASPLGGGIYIEVPYKATGGVVTITITGAARAPFFQATHFHQTTVAEWLNTERTNPAPWADFQSDKFMMQVPRSWIYNFTNPVTVMANWDAAMDACNDLMGFPHDRGKETMYYQVDLLLRASVYAPGYPTVNLTYDPTKDYGGNHNNYLLTGPQNVPSYVFHEQGHSYFFPKFPGETESAVHLLHVAVMHRKFGFSLDDAFRTSVDYGNFRKVTNAPLDNTAVLWMTSFNFSPRKLPMAEWEKAYQPQGHAKFVDLVRLFGWSGLDAFWYYYNSNDTYGVSYPTDSDSMLLQLCKSVGKDIRPLFHFWGIFPIDAARLQSAINAAGLKAPAEIYDRLVHYKSLVPTNNAAYQAWCLMWYGHQPSTNGYAVEREHARQWSTNLLNGADPQVRFPTEIFDEAAAEQVKARVQEIIDLYYPNGRPAPPEAPSGLVAAATNAAVNLTWNIVSGATGYNVKRALSRGGPHLLIASTVNTNYTDTAVTNGLTYYYVVSATNLFGESGNSIEVSARPEAPPVTPPVLNRYGPWSHGWFRLTFSGPTGQTYKVLASTNVTLPVATWTVLSSGTFGPSPVTYIHTSATNAQQFYCIQSP